MYDKWLDRNIYCNPVCLQISLHFSFKKINYWFYQEKYWQNSNMVVDDLLVQLQQVLQLTAVLGINSWSSKMLLLFGIIDGRRPKSCVKWGETGTLISTNNYKLPKVWVCMLCMCVQTLHVFEAERDKRYWPILVRLRKIQHKSHHRGDVSFSSKTNGFETLTVSIIQLCVLACHVSKHVLPCQILIRPRGHSQTTCWSISSSFSRL